LLSLVEFVVFFVFFYFFSVLFYWQPAVQWASGLSDNR